MITDIQKLSERDSDPIIKNIKSLDIKDISIIAFIKILLALKTLLKNKSFLKSERKIILKNFIKIFIFKRFILKNNDFNKLVERNTVPKKIINELETYIKIDKSKVKDEIFRQDNIIPIKNSDLDRWIKKNFLSKARKYLRGVVGYKVHARFANNQGNLKLSSRFKYSYSNLHWDFALNSMPLVIYLNDVDKGDGEFKILKSSIKYNQNLYLSFYDFFLSDKNGINNSIMSNRAGSHMNKKDKKVIEEDIKFFSGKKGTSILFSGRYILHCGGYPEVNRNRLSVFLSHKNILMAIINHILKLI